MTEPLGEPTPIGDAVAAAAPVSTDNEPQSPPSVDDSPAARAAAARADAELAQRRVEAAEADLAAGDDTITADELDMRQRTARHAMLVAEGAEKRRAAAERAEAVDAARVALDQVAGITLDDDVLVDAWADAVRTLHRVAVLAAKRTATLRANEELLAQHDHRLRRLGAGDLAALGGHYRIAANEYGYRLPKHQLTVRDIYAPTLVASVVVAAVSNSGTANLNASTVKEAMHTGPLEMQWLDDRLSGIAAATADVPR